MKRRPGALIVAGLASLANGVALVLAIVAGLPLGALLAITWSVAVLALLAMAVIGGAALRAVIVRIGAVGVGVGVMATLAYDVTKAVLSQIDPSPFNPFEATRIFGTLLVGADAPSSVVTIVGWAFHLSNGCTFAVAFAALFARGGLISRRRGVLMGVGWGLFLETFQLALFPGWLNIKFLDEFRQISFLSHVVFGAILGLLVPAGLRWSTRRMAPRRGTAGG